MNDRRTFMSPRRVAVAGARRAKGGVSAQKPPAAAVAAIRKYVMSSSFRGAPVSGKFALARSSGSRRRERHPVRGRSAEFATRPQGRAADPSVRTRSTGGSPLRAPRPDVVRRSVQGMEGRSLRNAKLWGRRHVCSFPRSSCEDSYQDAWTRSQRSFGANDSLARELNVVIAIERWKSLLSPDRVSSGLGGVASIAHREPTSMGTIVFFKATPRLDSHARPRIAKVELKDFSRDRSGDHQVHVEKVGEGNRWISRVRRRLADVSTRLVTRK